jgi:3-hydroxyisobutyrate dehydrogenase-like beta-hydroxyacid dehydrogenase
VRVSLKSVSGVDSVDVSLTKGLAVVKMKPGNATTLKQLSDAVTKNGFTMKDSPTTVAGTVVDNNGKLTLRVSGSNDMLELSPQSNAAASPTSLVGKPVVIGGTIPEGTKGKTPDSIRYESITEEKQ